MNAPTYPRPGPCAGCGKPHGGQMNSTAWGHGALCCSEACGQKIKTAVDAMRSTPEYKQAVENLYQAQMRLSGMEKSAVASVQQP